MALKGIHIYKAIFYCVLDRIISKISIFLFFKFNFSIDNECVVESNQDQFLSKPCLSKNMDSMKRCIQRLKNK